MSKKIVHERVIVLHGIFRTSRSMQKLADFIGSQGYKIININYPSTKIPIEEIVEYVHGQIPESDATTHFVGYSMGGLIIRNYVAKYRPKNMGRVVMIGTPNNGSEVADFLKNFPLYKKFYGPAGQQLVTKDINFAKPDYELGIIAGNRTIDPICYFLLPRPNDGKVSVASTRLDGMKEHIVIPASHTFFPVNKKAWKLTYDFLKVGSFTTAGGASRDARV